MINIFVAQGGYFVWVRLPDGFPLTAEGMCVYSMVTIATDYYSFFLQEFTTRCLTEAKIRVFAGPLSR